MARIKRPYLLRFSRYSFRFGKKPISRLFVFILALSKLSLVFDEARKVLILYLLSAFNILLTEFKFML